MKKDKISFDEARQIKEALDDRSGWMQEIGDPETIRYRADERLSVLEPIFSVRDTDYRQFVYLIEPNDPKDPDFFNRQYKRFDFRDIGIHINDEGVDMPILRKGRGLTKGDIIKKQAHLIRDLREKDLHKDNVEIYRLYQKYGI